MAQPRKKQHTLKRSGMRTGRKTSDKGENVPGKALKGLQGDLRAVAQKQQILKIISFIRIFCPLSFQKIV